jgi:6-phosphogluconolactonase
MTPAPVTEVLRDADRLAAAVAERLLDRLAAAQADGRIPQIGLTGGSIADAVHRQLALMTPTSGVDWSKVVVWWGDERFVPPDSPDRNALQARRALLDHVGVDPAHVHEMASTADVADIEEGAAAHDQAMHIHGAGEFDVLMLGVGPDGHVASLFPGHPALDVDDRITTWVEDSPKPPPRRLSLTFAALNRARAVWFLVSGADKAPAVAAALAGGDLHEIPARGVRGRLETVWFLDEPASGQLDPHASR